MSAAAPARAHLDALTGIRGLAAWLVVFYHIRLSLRDLVPGFVIDGLGKGYLAVDLFFMLSGFVLWYNYGARLSSGGAGQWRAFYQRRLARIWPLHAVILAACVGFALLLAATGRQAPGMPFAQLPLHILLVQNWGFTSALAWNDPSWSISTEFAAYLVFPLIVALAPWERLRLPALTGLSVLLLGALAGLFAYAGKSSLGDDISHLGLGRCLLEFWLGNCACLIWQRLPRGGWIATGCAAGAAALLAACLGAGVAEIWFVPAALLLALLALLGLSLGRGVVVKALSSRPLVYLGEISYATYLAHFLLFKLYKLAFVDASLQLDWTALGGFAALLFAVSAFLYHGLEKPAQRWINGLKRPLQAGCSSAAA
ncbi:acyltransferase family protein [Novosphingobium beihaiensis]|uniref:Acyltransferase n=1 Tax=Novosphingobium beihaiensis TaxID=2930389 RepID=A0ABT0BU67_9SPHN|nr:acyltransferase [Novosphingobium beihaiensis]MCJ2188567.1 acyltransferase [Novosphingobium beihaiensis]